MHNRGLLSIDEARRQLRCGEITATELVNACLDRISQRDKAVKAWVEVYEERALAEAQKCDEALRQGDTVLPLHGIPVGIKDIIDVQGMWTRAGCAAHEAKIAEVDAAAVASLRQAGAIILGKTETTAFANNDPTITCNPGTVPRTYTRRIEQRVRCCRGRSNVFGCLGNANWRFDSPSCRLYGNRGAKTNLCRN